MEKLYFEDVKNVEVKDFLNGDTVAIITLHKDGDISFSVPATGYTKSIADIILAWEELKGSNTPQIKIVGDNGNDYTLTIMKTGDLIIEGFENTDLDIKQIIRTVKTLKEEETLRLEYCPHCGSSAKEQGVESHTSGFACNLCQKWIPFRSECGLVIEEVKPSTTPVKILWFSRHVMTIEQHKDLERIYGAVNVTRVDMSIKHVDEIDSIIEDNDILAVVAPPELLHEFVNYPGRRPVIVAKSERILVPSSNGAESKIEFKFMGWDLMEEYTIKTRRL